MDKTFDEKLLEMERRFHKESRENQKELLNFVKLFLAITGSFVLILGSLMTVLKIWS